MRKVLKLIFVLVLLLNFSTILFAADKEDFRAYNEWGKLRVAMVGTLDDLVMPNNIPEMERWMTAWGKEDMRKYHGKACATIVPDEVAKLKKELERFVSILEENGVKVYRNIPLRYPEERAYLNDVQEGGYFIGGADFLRVFDDKVLLISNFRYPFRRKQAFAVRPVIEKLMKKDQFYVAMPPCSPHMYPKDDAYLENGDMMFDGKNVYVGISGNASNENGAKWLQSFLGPKYKVWTVKLDSSAFHLDTVLSLNRPGLLTYYPEIVKELPEPLKSWDKIKVYKEKGEEEVFGANNLSLDENTIIVAEEYKRLKPEYEKRGMKVILVPLAMNIEYGAGSRCLTGIIQRDK
ncbi:MAG: hypothetical protein ISS89_05115 [Candidatus Omnitrophica bacterium]|nr:hypothetical protein [Candidatus Omnitrophota bacterium]